MSGRVGSSFAQGSMSGASSALQPHALSTTMHATTRWSTHARIPQARAFARHTRPASDPPRPTYHGPKKRRLAEGADIRRVGSPTLERADEVRTPVAAELRGQNRLR